MFLVGTIPPRDSGREFGPLFWAGIPPGGLIDGRSHGVVDRSLCGGRITWAPPPGVHRLLRRAPGKAPRRCGGDPRNAACVEGWKDVGDGGPDCLPICNRPTKRTACSVREDGPRALRGAPHLFLRSAWCGRRGVPIGGVTSWLMGGPDFASSAFHLEAASGGSRTRGRRSVGGLEWPL